MPNRSLPLGLSAALALSLSAPALAADSVKIDNLVVAATIPDAEPEATLFAAEASAQTTKPTAARNVVLVHGAWADGSSWSEVISRLQAAGLHVTAVQNPLTALADSVAATRRALALQDGPTVLVAHSWGGTVISEAGADPKVTALVYVAARAPDAGEDFVALSGRFPTMPVRAGVQERDGFTNLSEEAFLKYFANGVAHERAEVLCQTRTHRRFSVRRANHGGCLALQTELVCGLEARSDDLA
jgi:pimeloyl-ACP methyl ester carboxylesterase